MVRNMKTFLRDRFASLLRVLRFPKPEKLTARQKRKLHDHFVWGTVYAATGILVVAVINNLFAVTLVSWGYLMFFLIANLTDPRLWPSKKDI